VENCPFQHGIERNAHAAKIPQLFLFRLMQTLIEALPVFIVGEKRIWDPDFVGKVAS